MGTCTKHLKPETQAQFEVASICLNQQPSVCKMHVCVCSSMSMCQWESHGLGSA